MVTERMGGWVAILSKNPSLIKLFVFQLLLLQKSLKNNLNEILILRVSLLKLDSLLSHTKFSNNLMYRDLDSFINYMSLPGTGNFSSLL